MIGVDYAMLPPEVNSGWMYAGPGAGSLMAAAAAWSGLAAELSAATANYQDVVSELAGEAWQGPAAASMAAAAAPFVHWMGTTAAQAEQAATQARAAAAAFETAFAATVPPPVIASNRTRQALLMATNTLGQNTAAIAANQAEYGQMWAQDAAAMYTYASASAAASTLTPFGPPPQNSNPAGEANQAAATSQAGSAAGSSAASALQNLAGPVATQGAVPGPIQSLIDSWLGFTGTPLISSANQLAGSFGLSMVNYGAGPFNSSAFQMLELSGMLGAGGANGTAAGQAAAAAALPAAALSSQVSGAGTGATLAGSASPVSASLGQAPSVRGLSVPHSWASASTAVAANSPAALYSAAALPSADLGAVPAATAMRAGGHFGDRPLIAGVVNTPKKGGSKSRFKTLARAAAPAAGKSDAYQGKADRWVQPSSLPAAAASSLSSHERRELEGLRSAVGELTKERDAAARLIRKEFRA
ncbi:PPE family protein [[Mycobacterium] vasticus]|uniref:PPE family protein n=1 Tax=[Mycobacterium] vasticus TaxID=2875777 RepID=A0ABU5Z744_9MYCO|nr:PPE family protein [Mycolicibacter sp. MYC017]MEB3072034.1 PPE family protein [Mycolicibacter sp. MYC017]